MSLITVCFDSSSPTRSMWTIVTSCFATIIACTWVAVHPNIPASNENAMRVLGRRLAIVFFMLLTPELVIYWATRQYFAAYEIARRHKSKGWTMTHGFFLGMGGFALYENDTFSRIIEEEDLEILEKEGKIEWPKITADDINDRSKGDFFSKGVVIMQSTWFIIQCIMRVSHNMTLTQLEVGTLAYAPLTMLIYALWWRKPLGVGRSVPVYMKKPPPSPDKQKSNYISTLPTIPEDDKDDSLNILPLNTAQRHEITLSPDLEAQFFFHHSKSSPSEYALFATKIRVYLETTWSDLVLSTLHRFRVYWRSRRETRGFILSVVSVFIYRPLVEFLGFFDEMVNLASLKENINRVPTFYAPKIGEYSSVVASYIMVLVGTVFGVIHCTAWSFKYPTIVEMWAWRICALVIFNVPVVVLIFGKASIKIDNLASLSFSSLFEFTNDSLVFCLFLLSMLVYISARVILVVLIFISLRELPAGAFVDINWVSYLPHI